MRFRFCSCGLVLVVLLFSRTFVAAQSGEAASTEVTSVEAAESGGGAGAASNTPAPVAEAPAEPALPPVPAAPAEAALPPVPVAPPAPVVEAPVDTTSSLSDILDDVGDAAENALLEIEEATDTFGIVDLLKRIGITLVIIAVQIVLIWLVWEKLFKMLASKTLAWGGKNIKPLTIKKLRLLSVQQMLNVLLFLLKILKYILTVFQLFLTLPIVFSLFPATQNLADTLFGYILNPLKRIFSGIIAFIPNLITIVIILWVTKYILRGLKFFATQIEKERLVINGFYADWAGPTYNILRVLVYAFAVIVIFPYLPGSGSPVFQGVSVFVGVIFSLGSSAAIGNLMAGLVMTYMRPFKIGDRIKIQDVTGFVVEKSQMVTRIRTHKNEYITYPNMMILNSAITNYNTSAAEDEEGLILYAEVTMNYVVPWPKVHEILIDAALKTTSILQTPKPYVLQTALDDFYCRYQINAYTKDVERIPRIYSELFENLQNGFAEAAIDLTAPQYRINMPYDPPVKEPKPKTVLDALTGRG